MEISDSQLRLEKSGKLDLIDAKSIDRYSTFDWPIIHYHINTTPNNFSLYVLFIMINIPSTGSPTVILLNLTLSMTTLLRRPVPVKVLPPRGTSTLVTWLPVKVKVPFTASSIVCTDGKLMIKESNITSDDDTVRNGWICEKSELDRLVGLFPPVHVTPLEQTTPSLLMIDGAFVGACMTNLSMVAEALFD